LLTYLASNSKAVAGKTAAAESNPVDK
jgi:hypothetical protein